MRRLLMLLTAMIVAAGLTAAPAGAVDSPIGRIGQPLRVQFKGLIADVTVVSVEPSPIPPGFGYPPRPPRNQVWRANVVVQPIKVPVPYAMAITFQFRGVTPTGDAYEPRNTDAPDALQAALTNAPPGSTVSGGVWWDCYRDLVSNVVLVDKITGEHLAQWNL
ncbi:hypothetical protein [Mycolicibacterium monacense]|uniref:Exported alanine and valine rich protein n=2 Tax=Mycobacteriaceae TaxID=1762 RepID=A0AAD1IZA3_MYCMB|nr:hypothetical protein [Mycolicibacterium monacense]MDA4105002.1 hypothetical protein [Mycolicibacterium monacense DSM 44395]OBB68789.1 hypothetical protein A6B34_19540 [Mycolicibacterium monacense]OBF56924.1 hypothetical protein A5778_05545 [Mycolicibacterium monacense]ORB23827.1 hypothetical protein BST34_02120 [Mycolicibacterium monacense DSM 44395]QHP85914.1 hypothetical protein EWR22_11300 [Mycolicibacterium monacense DSM 44395]